MGEKNDGTALVQFFSPEVEEIEERLGVPSDAGNGLILVDVAAIAKR